MKRRFVFRVWTLYEVKGSRRFSARGETLGESLRSTAWSDSRGNTRGLMHKEGRVYFLSKKKG